MLQIVMRPKRISLLAVVIAAALAIWAGCLTAKSSDPAPATALAAEIQIRSE